MRNYANGHRTLVVVVVDKQFVSAARKRRLLFRSVKDVPYRRIRCRHLQETRKIGEAISSELKWPDTRGPSALCVRPDSFGRSIAMTRHICLSAKLSTVTRARVNSERALMPRVEYCLKGAIRCQRKSRSVVRCDEPRRARIISL